ncbi:hypothetical protein SOVF_074870, partial [Spinacia oleracea]
PSAQWLLLSFKRSLGIGQQVTLEHQASASAQWLLLSFPSSFFFGRMFSSSMKKGIGHQVTLEQLSEGLGELMPRPTRRKLAERSAVRATMEDASDDEAATMNVPESGMVPRRAPVFNDNGWRSSDLAFRPEFYLSQRPRAGLEEEINPEDIPYADRVIRYDNSDGEQVEVTVPVASPPYWRSYDAVPENYAPAPRVRVRRWILVSDSLKRNYANLTKKLSGRDREGTYRPSGTLRIAEQEPVTLGTELDQDLERYRIRNRNKEHVVDITADDDSD